jgi:hypothetical protein
MSFPPRRISRNKVMSHRNHWLVLGIVHRLRQGRIWRARRRYRRSNRRVARVTLLRPNKSPEPEWEPESESHRRTDYRRDNNPGCNTALASSRRGSSDHHRRGSQRDNRRGNFHRSDDKFRDCRGAFHPLGPKQTRLLLVR